ncbi:HAD family hydrolase [Paludisphaera borealis]|nr:HAD family phosphatase [Paludisphaera borealis]
MPPSAVLIAFDGVLADTENYHVAAWQRTLARLGWDVPDDVAARSAEIDDSLFAAEIFAHRGIVQADIDGWVRRKQALTLEMIRSAPRLFPGAADLVKSLAGHARLVVVADSLRDHVEALLERSGLADRIELIVAADDVKAVRPEPDGLRLAIKRLKVAAGHVLAIEGTPAGLRAARAAGISCMAVGHRRPFGEWVGDAPYVSGFEPVSGILAQLGFSREP